MEAGPLSEWGLRFVPEIQPDHLEPGGAGIRAQACDQNGSCLTISTFVAVNESSTSATRHLRRQRLHWQLGLLLDLDTNDGSL